MFHSSTICVQFILIGLGILFQVMAFSSKRNEKPIFFYCSHRGPSHDSKEDENSIIQAVTLSTRRSWEDKKSARDFYETENLEPGVRPAELLRTKKVAYFNDVNVKQTG